MADLAHTYDCPDTNAIVSLAPDFTIFTKPEAGLCDIIYTYQIKLPPILGGTAVFAYWQFKVKDNEGNTYTWNDFSTASDDDKPTVKAAILNHLINYVRKVTVIGTYDKVEKITTAGKILLEHSERVTTIITDKGSGEGVID